MLVLVIDDCEIMRATLVGTLSTLGYSTVTASHGGEALSLLESGVSPDICLVEARTPAVGQVSALDGLGFIQAVARRIEWRHLVIMLVTDAREPGTVVRALASGAHEYLLRPFTTDQLAAKLGGLGLPAQRQDDVPA